jgi:hypothetical protein
MSHELLFTEHENSYAFGSLPVVYCTDSFIE